GLLSRPPQARARGRTGRRERTAPAAVARATRAVAVELRRHAIAGVAVARAADAVALEVEPADRLLELERELVQALALHDALFGAAEHLGRDVTDGVHV